jgi:predicted lipoprotein with Yx(FWY)xxD motif
MRALIVVASATFVMAISGYALAQAPTMPAAVKVNGGMLTDAKGMTLYTFDNDKEANKSACAGNCLNNWPILKADAADKDMGDWKVITRDDGTKQWAYKGKPLYYFAMDKAAGDKVGDGRGMVWHIAKP